MESTELEKVVAGFRERSEGVDQANVSAVTPQLPVKPQLVN
jgi:hypothetical protein